MKAHLVLISSAIADVSNARRLCDDSVGNPASFLGTL